MGSLAALRTTAAAGSAVPCRVSRSCSTSLTGWPCASAALPANAYFGTVGAVALDRHGHVAAATSTGGMTNKRWGRVCDVPVIGAGTYADDGCAVSATGWGEFFIRLTVAHDICARMRYRGDSLKAASDEVVLRRVVELGGNGGVIAIDRHGNIAQPFNTSGMYRGWLRPDGSRGTAVFRESGMEKRESKETATPLPP